MLGEVDPGDGEPDGAVRAEPAATGGQGPTVSVVVATIGPDEPPCLTVMVTVEEMPLNVLLPPMLLVNVTEPLAFVLWLVLLLTGGVVDAQAKL